MKEKNNTKLLIITSIVCLLPIVLSILLYKDLPDQIAIHWNVFGEPDNYVSKSIAAFGLPVLFVVLNVVTQLVVDKDPSRANVAKAMRIIVAWLVPILSVITIPMTLYNAMGVDIQIIMIVYIMLGVIFILFGNYLPKSRQNYSVGIRIPWTLSDSDNWNKTHRLAGYLWILSGILVLLRAFIWNNNSRPADLLFISFLLIPLIVIPVFYSYFIYRKANHD